MLLISHSSFRIKIIVGLLIPLVMNGADLILKDAGRPV